METKAMKILVIEDDIEDCNKIKECSKNRDDIEIVAITDSDINGVKLVKEKRPEGIILDLELNNSNSGNSDSFGFMSRLKKLNLNYEPIVIVTTYINSKITYDKLHREGVELILYKGQNHFSYNNVFNNFINLRQDITIDNKKSVEDIYEENQNKISDCIYKELELVGISPKMVGRKYLHDAIYYMIENPDSEVSVSQYLTKIYKKSGNTISTGMQNAINHAWKVTAIEDLEENYTARININTGIPTPSEFTCYYRDKIRKLL